jgi:hypothetical protein
MFTNTVSDMCCVVCLPRGLGRTVIANSPKAVVGVDSWRMVLPLQQCCLQRGLVVYVRWQVHQITRICGSGAALSHCLPRSEVGGDLPIVAAILKATFNSAQGGWLIQHVLWMYCRNTVDSRSDYDCCNALIPAPMVTYTLLLSQYPVQVILPLRTLAARGTWRCLCLRAS